MFDKINEYLIYIHGVSQDNNRKHQKTYDSLHNGVKSVKKPFPNRADWDNANRCDVEWGWHYDARASFEGDRLLAQAQEQFAERLLPQVKEASDWTINPARLLLLTLREMTIKGFSDIFYYASRDGKNSIRATVASQILPSLRQPLENNEPISLTFLGHSAGSVVAFDFLFYLFAPSEVLEEHEFIEDLSTEREQDFHQLRQLAEAGKLRVRRLVTFGSPISMMAFRSNAVLKILAQGDRLNPSYYGLDRNPEGFGNPLGGSRWLNFWDKDDFISWPVRPLMQDSPMVEDIYTDIADRLATVHNEYWDSQIMHEEIAARW
ncbi:MAG: hypothetical protein SWY16_08330 [Cyanobacteriota bacterium]|nr:hypothetical protein [Cyanobacteriota bacterium]